MNLANLLMRAGRTASGQVAVYQGTTAVRSYSVLSTRVASLAGALARKYSLSRGDRALLVMSNCPAYVECLFACWHAGLICVPINAKLHEREIAFVLENSGAKLAFVTADLASTLAGSIAVARRGNIEVVEVETAAYERTCNGEPVAPCHAASDHPAWLFYTSGTTGRPKGATLTHRNLMAMTLNYFVDVDTPAARDCILHAAPMSHGSGLYMLPHVAAMAAQVLPESRRFEPGEVFDLLGRHKGVSLFAAPTMVRRLVQHSGSGGGLEGLNTIIYGGGPMYVEDCKEALAVFGSRLVQIYGQGESPMTITVLPKRMHAQTDGRRYDDRLASVGYPQTVVEVRTVRSDGETAALGEPGEVLVQGDTVMTGYWNDPEATRETLRGGWLKTGDMGYFDEDGFLTLKDRSKDVIISGGTNIYPREVEEVLLKHPSVAEVAVVGRASAEWGEDVVAFVVPHAGKRLLSVELDALCQDHIARFKRPKDYMVLEALPKNHYGKIVKTSLRDLLKQDKPKADPLTSG